MGDKAAAPAIAASLGRPDVPGYDGPLRRTRPSPMAAARIGFPLLVKPSAGGGGKGMRIVRVVAELPTRLAAQARGACPRSTTTG